MIERKIGERFFDGDVQLQVEEDKYLELDIAACKDCYYKKGVHPCDCNRQVAGQCIKVFRKDKKSVRFVEV